MQQVMSSLLRIYMAVFFCHKILNWIFEMHAQWISSKIIEESMEICARIFEIPSSMFNHKVV